MMKIIDLLNKIANGEEVPKSFKYLDFVYIWNEKRKAYFDDTNHICFGCNHLIDFCLNDEVEIIEEDKKIEKIKIVENGSVNSYALLDKNRNKCALTKHSKIMCDKINEIIDKLNEAKDE